MCSELVVDGQIQPDVSAIDDVRELFGFITVTVVGDTMTQRYCRNCGTELRPGARYCSECGHRTDSGEGGQHTGTRPEYQPDAQDGTNSGSGEWGAGAGTQRMAHRRDSGPDTTLAVVAHVLGLLTWVIGPLIIYAAADDPFAKENAANATDWQIMLTVYMIISFVLIFAVVGIVLVFIIPLLDMVFCLLAAVKASDGKTWQYPLTPDIL